MDELGEGVDATQICEARPPKEILESYFEKRQALVKTLQQYSSFSHNRILQVNKRKSNGKRAILVCKQNENCNFFVVIHKTIRGWHVVQESSNFAHCPSCLHHRPICSLDTMLKSRRLINALLANPKLPAKEIKRICNEDPNIQGIPSDTSVSRLKKEISETRAYKRASRCAILPQIAEFHAMMNPLTRIELRTKIPSNRYDTQKEADTSSSSSSSSFGISLSQAYKESTTLRRDWELCRSWQSDENGNVTFDQNLVLRRLSFAQLPTTNSYKCRRNSIFIIARSKYNASSI